MWYLWLMSQVLIKCSIQQFFTSLNYLRKILALPCSIILTNRFLCLGKEKLLGDAYIDQVLALDSPQLTYITFDFHEYCRGLKFENVAVLLESIQDILKFMRYCWVDHKVCRQFSRAIFYLWIPTSNSSTLWILTQLTPSSQGLICEQQSVFRINCVDCLDRTNIVQTAIARNILEIQFRKVGLLPPEVNLPADCRWE